MSTHSMVALIMLMTSLPAMAPRKSSSSAITSGFSSAIAWRPACPSAKARTGTEACSSSATAAARVCASSSISSTVLVRRVRRGRRRGRGAVEIAPELTRARRAPGLLAIPPRSRSSSRMSSWTERSARSSARMASKWLRVASAAPLRSASSSGLGILLRTVPGGNVALG